MWADHRVKAGGDAVYEMRHPLVGAMDVTQQTLRTEDGQTVVVATTEPGSASHAAMTLLVHGAVTPVPALRSPSSGASSNFPIGSTRGAPRGAPDPSRPFQAHRQHRE